jgi:hypothetical protein
MHQDGAKIQVSAPVCLLNTTSSNFLQIGNGLQLTAVLAKFTTQIKL